ncbi:MAG: radical SAM protein [Desulfobacterales bacterium]|nr:radical SAM protein [Desulfobacterales bacterium]
MAPHILLINPWIHDFAAYDVWAKPFGLLQLAGILRAHGFRVSYLDCLDRFHPREKPADPAARNGRGPYRKERIAKPAGLSDVPRYFSRYGIRPEWFREDLAQTARPDLILVTSLMTYWYTGVAETIAYVRSVFPDVPILLGGIYATLCPDHASQATGADAVFEGGKADQILDIVQTYTGGAAVSQNFDPHDPDTYPWPAFDLQHRIGYIPLLTSLGCPYACDYCASKILQPRRMVRTPAHVVEEIRYWHDKCGVKNFVFYDDALLVNSEKHARPLFEQIISAGLDIRFHTPNAVHIREITRETAQLMASAGFATLRLGLETLDFNERRMDHKVKKEEFLQAAAYLTEAGFNASQVGAYLLVGLPEQELTAVAEAIRMVRQTGITPILAYYSPIPKTAMWPAAVKAARYDLAADPIYTNNAIFPCQPAFDWQELSRLKRLIAS